MFGGTPQESQTLIIRDLPTSVGNEGNPTCTDLMTPRKFETPLTEVECPQFRFVLKGIGYVDIRCNIVFVVSY
jgi:hypothetical protein